MSPSKKPNLFVIGAPKCGTTSLCAYLERHPQVLFSTPKEPKFFHTDFSHEHRIARDESEYLDCFQGQTPEHRIIAEGTVWYLYSRVAVPKILEFNPSARLIVMLRNPVDLAQSLHSQLVYGGDEDVRDFETAWSLQRDRAAGNKVPAMCRDPKVLQYGAISKLGEQIERLYRVANRENVLLIRFEELAARPEQVYRQTLDFLELPDDQQYAFPRHNPNKVLRPGPLPSLLFAGGYLKRKLGIRRSLGVWKKLEPLTSVVRERTTSSSEMRVKLSAYFRDDLQLLRRVTGQDFSQWGLPDGPNESAHPRDAKHS